MRQGGIEWRWNWHALADLWEIEHLLDTDTLHSGIHRVPAGGVVHFRDGKIEQQQWDWRDRNQQARSHPEEVVEAINDEVKFWFREPAVLSLSSGFDSRVILSSLLKQGIAPRLLVMGREESSDVTVVRSISERHRLPLTVVDFYGSDMLQSVPEILRITNGTKPATHWHTYFYVRKDEFRDIRLFVGTNGEFARTYYCDKGGLARVLDLPPFAGATRPYWQARIRRHHPFKTSEFRRFAGPLGDALFGRAKEARLQRLARIGSGKTFLEKMDDFYLKQHVRNFNANGIALIGSWVNPVMPFLGQKWVEAVDRLPRRWRMGNRWHRFALQRNWPDLLKLAEPGVSSETAAEPQTLYWLRKDRSGYVGYFPYHIWLRSDEVLEYIAAGAESAADVLDPGLIRQIVAEHRELGLRQHAIEMLLPLIAWIREIKLSASQATREGQSRVPVLPR
jgi:asparagine synthase (glutamine-hydrolysing)